MLMKNMRKSGIVKIKCLRRAMYVTEMVKITIEIVTNKKNY